MGYGLAGAIGASLANPDRRVLLIEGDGGFAQNLQELATVDVNRLNITIFLFANNGYGSIRTTQRNYFDGAYLGCDTKTGLGFPDWSKMFASYGIEFQELSDNWEDELRLAAKRRNGPSAWLVPIDSEQTYWPKITSRITASGSMESRPLHDMSPDLPPDLQKLVSQFL
jgi:acetolactate synthase-1/2/3 large subunit